MRVATIDIGTNTVLLLVAERSGGGGELVALEERATITRLGEGVDKTRHLAPQAIARTNAALDAYAEIIARCGVTRVDVVGTSAMRDAGGGEAVRDHVKAKLGVEARTISGEEEARLTFAGALSGIRSLHATSAADTAGAESPTAGVRVFDIGGGSTEVVHGERLGAREGSEGSGDTRGSRISYAHSFDVGSVRLTERHEQNDPPSEVDRRRLREAARAAFAAVPPFATEVPPVGIAGTMTTLAAVALSMEPYDGRRVHGYELPITEIERVVDELARLPLEKRSAVRGLEPKRADVIVAGGEIALAYLGAVGAKAVIVSDRGVRWGLAEKLAANP
jgi:exopolyphosphatase/guanosine-5'-triphosphate,3'-diphosphate pyrophosphatase